jgi:23S rRNA pseudouridine1911/1915/1917 synthase
MSPGLSSPAPGAERGEARVPEELDGERLDRALAALIPGLSRTQARRVIALGGAWIGTERIHVASRTVRRGDRLTATWHDAVREAPSWPLSVVYQDPCVVVVDKPSGQLSQASELGDEGSLARELGRRYGPAIRLMHRLDAGASGLLVAARDPEASAALTPQMRDHTIERSYVCWAGARPPVGPCEIPLLREGRRMRVAAAGEPGIPARTDFEVLPGPPARPGAVLVGATLHTGRTHQIRVHLASLGAPILGDRVYGGPDAARLCLHATRLAFAHPSDGRRICFEASPPPDFWAAAGAIPP